MLIQTSNSSGQPYLTLSNPDVQGTGTRIRFNQGGSNYGYISSAYSGGWNIDVRANTSGGVRLAANSTSWGSLSDERAKDIIEPIDNALTKVNTLRTVIGKYKETDDDDVRRSFLIAQDVEAVLPEAVSIDDEDNYHLRYTEVIPLLTAAIKELKILVDTQQQTIESLEARVATLESA